MSGCVLWTGCDVGVGVDVAVGVGASKPPVHAARSTRDAKSPTPTIQRFTSNLSDTTVCLPSAVAEPSRAVTLRSRYPMGEPSDADQEWDLDHPKPFAPGHFRTSSLFSPGYPSRATPSGAFMCPRERFFVPLRTTTALAAHAITATPPATVSHVTGS